MDEAQDVLGVYSVSPWQGVSEKIKARLKIWLALMVAIFAAYMVQRLVL